MQTENYLYKAGDSFRRALFILLGILSIFSTSCSDISYVSNKDVWKMDTDGNSKVKVIPGDYPKWRPNFKELLVFKEMLISPIPGESGSGEIWIINKDGTNPRRLTDEKSGNFFNFSPDGNSIVFQSYRDGGNWQIYTMMADGSHQKRLTNNNYINERPKWSPQGNRIIYQSQQKINANKQIISIDPNGSGLSNLSSIAGQGSFQHPVWSPDGKYVAFEGWLSAAPVSWNIYAVESSGQNFVASLTGLTSGKSYFSPILHYGSSFNNYYIFYQREGKQSGIYRKLWSPNESLGSEEFLPLPDNTYLQSNMDLNMCFPFFIYFTGNYASGLFIGRIDYSNGSNFKNLADGYRPCACLMN
jgi:hypothetical protein